MEEIVFYPKFSIWAYATLIGIEIGALILFIFTIYPIFKYQNLKGLSGLIVTALLMVIIMIIFGYLLVIYRSMRYEFREDGLHLICGGYHDVIKYEDIESWEKKNLVFNPLASKRFPGFSLGNVYYSDEGMVRMYATSAGSNVLLIKTKKRKYGVTPDPKDEEKFIKELEKKVKN